MLGKCQCVFVDETSHSLVACVVLCKFCYQQEQTTLERSIHKIHKGAISNVQKHMKKFHSVEIEAQSTAMFNKTMDANKKQRTLDCSISTKKQKVHAISAFQ